MICSTGFKVKHNSPIQLSNFKALKSFTSFFFFFPGTFQASYRGGGGEIHLLNSSPASTQGHGDEGQGGRGLEYGLHPTSHGLWVADLLYHSWHLLLRKSALLLWWTCVMVWFPSFRRIYAHVAFSRVNRTIYRVLEESHNRTCSLPVYTFAWDTVSLSYSNRVLFFSSGAGR